jgi:hypothetical protein
MVEDHHYTLQIIDSKRKKVEEMANLIDLDIESRNTETHRLNNQLEKIANISEKEIERNRKEIESQRSLSIGQCVKFESVKSTLTQSHYAINTFNVNE